MAVRTLVTVDVDDSRFKAFTAAFSKYHEALKEVAPEWEASALATHAAAEATADITAELEKQAKAQEKAETAARKAEREKEKAAKAQAAAQKKRLDDAKKEMAQIRDAASGVADFLMKGTASLVKWAGIGGLVGGLIGAGGLFGLDRLGASVSDTRRTALGFGVNPGDLQAFRVNFGRFVDPNSLLQNITEAQADPAKAWAFSAMGLRDYKNRSAADLGAEALPRAGSMWKEGGYNIQSAQGQILQALGFSVEDLNRLRNSAPGELAGRERNFRDDRSPTGFGRINASALAWQNFMTALQTAAVKIEDTFVKVLGDAKIPQEFEALSESVAKTIETFLSHRDIGAFFDKIAGGVKWLAESVSSGEFQTNFNRFISDVGDVAAALEAALKTLGIIKDHAPAGNPDPKGRHGLGTLDYPFGAPRNNPGNLRDPGNPFKFQQFSSQADGVKAMARQLLRYEYDKKWGHKDTLRSIISTYAPRSENDTEAYIRFVSKLTGIDPESHLDLGLNGGAQLAQVMAAMMKKEYSTSKETSLDVLKTINPAGAAALAAGNGRAVLGRQTLDVKLNINNNTGGNANVQATQAAAQ